MKMMRWLAACAGVAMLLTACGGGDDRTKAKVRFVNASGYTQLDLRVHDELRQGQVSYGNSASYVEIDPDRADTAITNAGSSTALLSFTPTLSERKHYTVLAYGLVGALKQVLLDENEGDPDNNKARLRVLNGASDAGSVDIYLTGANDTLTSAVAVKAGAVFGTLNEWQTVDSGTYRLRVTAANSKTDVRLDITGFSLGNKQIATLVLAPAAGGVLVNGMLLTQQGSIGRLDTTQARVRAVAGMTDSAAVSVRLGEFDLLSGISSPAVGNYVLVPAGAQQLAVTVNGTALAATTQTLVAGADYTVLTYGTPAAPLARLITDDNQLPSDTTQAKIRLVNGVSGLTSPLTLTVDLSPVGAGVESGFASDYATVLASTTAELSATSPGVGSLYREVDRTLLAGSTYTVFVLGGNTTATARGILRKDR